MKTLAHFTLGEKLETVNNEIYVVAFRLQTWLILGLFLFCLDR